MINNKKFLVLSVSFVLCMTFGIGRAHAQNNKELYENIKKFSAFMQMVEYAYVDTVNDAKLVEKAIIETLQELDPHSTYISKKDVKRANEPLEGNFEGVGIQFEILRDTINVVHSISGGPSEKLGIMAGDKIVKIDGQPSTGKSVTNQYVLDHLRGKKGSKVVVSISRSGKKELIDYSIIRDKIPINSIDAVYMITPQTGYINLNRFAQTSMQEFVEATLKLQSQGMKNLILDLRNNSGGYMGTAIDLSDQFLDAGKLIVYTEGIHSPREDYTSNDKGLFQKGKLVIMMNENSASASEIVAGAVQDWDRGIIVGRRSFGKGLVQRPFSLPDSSQVRLTTARYHTPSGRCIQKSYAEGTDKYYMDFAKRVKRGELIHPDSIKFPDSLKFRTLSGKIVYGGGGIMPDIFIPIEKDSTLKFYNLAVNKSLVYQWAFDYTDKFRSRLSRFKNVDTFESGFNISDEMYADFLAYALKKGLKHEGKNLAESDHRARVLLKAYIGRNLLDNEGFYPILNSIDPAFIKAVEIVKNHSK